MHAKGEWRYADLGPEHGGAHSLYSEAAWQWGGRNEQSHVVLPNTSLVKRLKPSRKLEGGTRAGSVLLGCA